MSRHIRSADKQSIWKELQFNRNLDLSFLYLIFLINFPFRIKCDKWTCGSTDSATVYEILYFDTCYEEIQSNYWNTYNIIYLVNKKKRCYILPTTLHSSLSGCMPLAKVQSDLKDIWLYKSNTKITAATCVNKCAQLGYNYALLDYTSEMGIDSQFI